MKSYGLCAIEFVNLCNSAGHSIFLRKKTVETQYFDPAIPTFKEGFIVFIE